MFLVSAAGFATPVRASTVDRLCSRPSEPPSAYPSNTSLEQAAALVEGQLQQDRLSGSAGTSEALRAAADELELADTDARPPSAHALANYCSAAGELMRVSPEGSQREAQIYFRTALQNSRLARLPSLTALTAYRLGIVSVSRGSVAGLRGGQPLRRSGQRIVGRLRSAEAEEQIRGEICAGLSSSDESAALDSSLTMVALDCAARVALESNSPAISSLASLRFARFALDWQDSADDPQELVHVARDKSIGALAVAATITEPGLRAELLGRLARTALELGAQPDDRLGRAVELIRSSANGEAVALATAAEIDARLLLAKGDRAGASRFLEAAIIYESSRPLPVRLPEYLLLLGEAEPVNRDRHVAAAYATLENIRSKMPRLDPITEESIFTLHMRRVFESAADVQLELAEADDRGGHIRSAQQIVEAFREAELQSAVGSECLQARTAVEPQDLADGENLLYPLLFNDRVELIYASGSSGSRQFRRLEPNRTVNRREVAKLSEALVIGLTRGLGDEWRRPAARLYEILIKPIEEHLAPDSTLAIIPDGPLRSVPFAALLSSDGRFLVERTALSVAPALAYSQPGAVRKDGGISILAASLARPVSLPAGFFPALAGTAAEARIAAENGSPGKLVENFTRQELLGALRGKPVDILHLATHAAFNGRSDRAFIVADGDVIRLSELRAILAQNRVRADLLNLLVLSACETAVGDDEASMGLAGAAVQTGALSAIASLWQVTDTGTSELMRQFYPSYRSGKSRAQSLREAQLSLIHGGGDNADPFVWAAFTLLGAWR
jgi:CHAT domain-containing protein